MFSGGFWGSPTTFHSALEVGGEVGKELSSQWLRVCGAVSPLNYRGMLREKEVKTAKSY